jgi:hypothetical protein
MAVETGEEAESVLAGKRTPTVVGAVGHCDATRFSAGEGDRSSFVDVDMKTAFGEFVRGAEARDASS